MTSASFSSKHPCIHAQDNFLDLYFQKSDFEGKAARKHAAGLAAGGWLPSDRGAVSVERLGSFCEERPARARLAPIPLLHGTEGGAGHSARFSQHSVTLLRPCRQLASPTSAALGQLLELGASPDVAQQVA